MNFTTPPGPQKWIEMAPYGLVGGMAPGLTLIVFKEKKGDQRFAVMLSRLQSQVAIQQGLRKEETFSFLNSLFRSLDVQAAECYFIKNKDGEQFVRVQFEGAKKLSLIFKADEALAFCIYHHCRFFCTSEFIDSMREIRAAKHIKKIKREAPMYLN